MRHSHSLEINMTLPWKNEHGDVYVCAVTRPECRQYLVNEKVIVGGEAMQGPFVK